MRDDMSKVIVERPRFRSRIKSDDPKGYAKRVAGKYHDMEDLPFRESMKPGRKYSWYDRKELNENLSPLFRFLRSNAGRPWDKVYSEIRKKINANSAVQLHVLQHIYDFVQTHTFIGPDGGVWERNKYITPDRPIAEGRFLLYVHPVNGLLCRTKKKKEGKRKYKARRAAEKLEAADFITADNKWFKRTNGIWYVLQMRYIPKGPYTKDVVQISLGEERIVSVLTKAGATWDVCFCSTIASLTPQRIWEAYGRADVYCAGVKQANTNELRSAGLENAKEPEYVNGSRKPRRD